MPREYRDELIRLYAGNPVADIQNVAAFQKLRDEFARDRSFLAERHRIELAKNMIEAALDGEMTLQEQVQGAIQFLIQTRGDDKQRDLCHELIVARYAPRWTAAQRQYFDTAWEKVKLEYDYFLSFTSRYPVGLMGDNPINTAYKQFIISQITVDEFNKADRKNTNLLALAVHRLLSEPPIKGFYFPHKQYDNTMTEQKLKEACDNSLVFVQLVQTIMFAPPSPPNGTNYCFFEWDRVKTQFAAAADGEKRILFVVAAPRRDILLRVLPFIQYKNWHGHISQKDPPYLPEMEFRDVAKIKAIKQMFQEKIVPEIQAAWFRLIDEAP